MKDETAAAQVEIDRLYDQLKAAVEHGYRLRGEKLNNFIMLATGSETNCFHFNGCACPGCSMELVHYLCDKMKETNDGQSLSEEGEATRH